MTLNSAVQRVSKRSQAMSVGLRHGCVPRKHTHTASPPPLSNCLKVPGHPEGPRASRSLADVDQSCFFWLRRVPRCFCVFCVSPRGPNVLRAGCARRTLLLVVCAPRKKGNAGRGRVFVVPCARARCCCQTLTFWVGFVVATSSQRSRWGRGRRAVRLRAGRRGGAAPREGGIGTRQR